MVGKLTPSTSLNTLGSVVYCCLALAVHGYASYLAALRYREAEARAWPGAGGGGKPGAVGAYLALLVLSLACLPIFVVTAVLRVGNYANDGTKLGRDHALDSSGSGGGLDAMGGVSRRKKKQSVPAYLWRHFLPLAQTIHVISAFCLVLPETLLTAAEVDFGYKTTDAAWSTDLDFLFYPERAHMSDISASVNVTSAFNTTVLVVPTPRPPPGGWTNRYSLTLAYVELGAALLALAVRYAAVFWFTNKALSAVLALQLLAMTVSALFLHAGFSLLYKVRANQDLYRNAHISLSCPAIVIMYLCTGLILLFSSLAVFHYGAHYFRQKFQVVERKHQAETFEKKVLEVQGGCQGYVPHTSAMLALLLLAACQGPLLYQLVAAYRATKDGLVLSVVVVGVCYMVMWTALWFGLTIKQQWTFRVLDYVPLGQSVFVIKASDNVVKNPTFDHDHSQENSLRRERRRRGLTPPGYAEAVAGRIREGEEAHSVSEDDNPEDPDHPRDARVAGRSQNGALRRKSRERKNGNQRVTFDDVIRSSMHGPEITSLSQPRSRTPVNLPGVAPTSPPDVTHLHVTVDVHSGSDSGHDTGSVQGSVQDSVQGSLQDGMAGGGPVKLRPRSSSAGRLPKQSGAGPPGDHTTARADYRNSLRSKCGEYFTIVPNVNNLSMTSEDASISAASAQSEPLPTLMSSFRDKVRESSRAASSYREQRRRLGGDLAGSGDPGGPGTRHDAPSEGSGSLDRMLDGGGLRPRPADVQHNKSSSFDSYDSGAVHLLPEPPGERCEPGGGQSPSRLLLFPEGGSAGGGGSSPHKQPSSPIKLSSPSSPSSPSGDSFESAGSAGRRSKRGSDRRSPEKTFQEGVGDSGSGGRRGKRTSAPGGGSDKRSSGMCADEYRPTPRPPEISLVPDPTARPQPLVNGKASPERSLGGGGGVGGSGARLELLTSPSDKGDYLHPRLVPVGGKGEIGRRDSANYSLTSSQDTSSNDSDTGGHALCSQV